jgi:hypothetical protein
VPELQNSENFRLLKLHYINTSGEKAVTEFEYDAFGNLIYSMWQRLDGERSSQNRYILNENAQISEKHRVFSDTVTTCQNYTYNLCRKLIRETYSRSDGIEGFVDYQYDEHGRLVLAECRKMNGWFTGRIEYLYNSYEVMNKASIRQGVGIVGEISYQYDINGNLILEEWDFNGTWKQTFVYEYFDVPGNVYAAANPFIINSGFYRVEEEYYEYSGGGAGPSVYAYDDGKLVNKVFKRSDGLVTETVYQYENNGLLLSALRTYSDGKTADIFYAFNEDNKMVRRWFKRSDGLEGEDKYIYDAEGRLAMAEYRKMDAWLSGTIAFSHDLNGLPVKGFFKGDDNFDAEIYFFYDDYKNLVRVQWDFSFGKSQVYTFKYTPLFKEGKTSSTTF